MRLERVGQYLRNEDLVSPMKPSEKSLWNDMSKIPHLEGEATTAPLQVVEHL